MLKIDSNSIKRISSKCANWTNIESLHLANNQISTIHGNIKYLKNLQ
jgi:Leucine-rich repeat (LRR) protein